MVHISSSAAQIAIASNPVEVREGLRRLLGMSPLCQLSDDARGTAEIVLAEALNNIVEHAYAETAGSIEVCVQVIADHLCYQITDHGLPMPKGVLPEGHLRAIGPLEELPEGGFGWFLIRTLALDLAYQRIDGRNLLSFRVEIG